MVNFDPTITIGAVFIAVSNIVMITWFAGKMDKRIDMQGQRQDNMEKKIDALIVDIKESSRFGERMAHMEGQLTAHAGMIDTTSKNIEDLRRGRGWIGGQQGRNGLDGEY